MNRILISLSIIPCLPILLGGMFFVSNSGAFKGALWALSAVAVALGIVGTVGLVMAGLKTTYAHTKLKWISISLIVCGYMAVGLGVVWALESYQIDTQFVPQGATSAPFPIIQYSIVSLLLAWPLCSGAVAICKLSRSNS